MKVFDDKSVRLQIQKYKIRKQYQKACRYMESGLYELVDLKIRKPKHFRIYQFRITKKYRAIGYIENNSFVITELSDHQ